MLRLVPCLLAAASLLVAPDALAGEDDRRADYDRFGFYLGVGGSYSKSLFEDEIEEAFEDVAALDVDIEDSFGVNARAGVRLLSFLAIEAQYEWISEYDIDLDITAPIMESVTLDLETHTLTGNLKLLAPISRFHPYLLGGIGFQKLMLEGSALGGLIDVDEDDIALAGRVAAGIDVYLTPHVVLNAEVSGVLTNEEVSVPVVNETIQGIHYFAAGVGLQYRF